MPGEMAQFSLVARSSVPVYVPPASNCRRLTFACAGDSARAAWNQSGPPAPPPSVIALAFQRARRKQELGLLTREHIESVISSDLMQRIAFAVLMLLAFVCCCCCYRTYRFRRRLRYRVPHEDWAGAW